MNWKIEHSKGAGKLCFNRRLGMSSSLIDLGFVSSCLMLTHSCSFLPFKLFHLPDLYSIAEGRNHLPPSLIVYPAHLPLSRESACYANYPGIKTRVFSVLLKSLRGIPWYGVWLSIEYSNWRLLILGKSYAVVGRVFVCPWTLIGLCWHSPLQKLWQRSVW